MTPAALDRAVGAVRTATAGIAVALALFLLMRVSLVASFRLALLVLAALEILAAGRHMLSGGPWKREAVETAVKVAILAGAYVALGA